MTTITMPAPTRRRPENRLAAPARPARLATPIPPTLAGFCYATVYLSGRLSVLDALHGRGLFPLGRRTSSGTVYRIDLGDGIVSWLDGDHLDQSINPVAGQICLDLSGGMFVGPDDAPFICGPVLFTGPASSDPIGLSDSQLQRIVDAHAIALAGTGDLGDLDEAALAGLPAGPL